VRSEQLIVLVALEAWLRRHWLAAMNAGVAGFAGLPVLAPGLLALGWHAPALLIYGLYSTTCHQWPGRSYFLFGPQLVQSMPALEPLGVRMAHDFVGDVAVGFKMAYCQRNFAIYTTVLIAGLLYALVRDRARPLGWGAFATCLAPMAADGGLQLIGVHESSWELRSLSGALTGLAAVWLVYPRLESALRSSSSKAQAAAPSRESGWPTFQTGPP
jgi:uncharacterized membrane protein